MKVFNRAKGAAGEKMAVKYLKKQGYGIIETNYVCDIGEIDIIAYDREYIVFVEVKSRETLEFGYASEAVNHRKQRKISETAAVYIKQRRMFEANVRFDVIEVYLLNKKIVHIKNAFDSFLRY